MWVQERRKKSDSEPPEPEAPSTHRPDAAQIEEIQGD
jgi:hypothetical protein